MTDIFCYDKISLTAMNTNKEIQLTYFRAKGNIVPDFGIRHLKMVLTNKNVKAVASMQQPF